MITHGRGWPANARLSEKNAWLQPRPASRTGESRSSHRWNPLPHIDTSTCPLPFNTSRRRATTGWCSVVPGGNVDSVPVHPWYPAPDRDVIDAQVTLAQDLLQLSNAQRIPQVPADAQDNDLGLEMSRFEQRRTFASHAAGSLSDRSRPACNTTFTCVQKALYTETIPVTRGNRAARCQLVEKIKRC